MEADLLIIALVVYAAILTQAISGSGLALISMPLLVPILMPVPAASLVALMAITTQLVMLTRYRQHVNFRAIWRLMVGSVVGIPLGVLALAQLDSRIILTVLGALLVGYSLYSLRRPVLPVIVNKRWAFAFGFASGLLGGAYNTGGPPYVIYGTACCWQPAEYKGNLQALLMVNSALTVTAHLFAGHYTGDVLRTYAVAVPMILLGTATGFWLDRHINEALFRKIVLIVLLIIGVRMLIP
jgi:hypothetical protein